MSKEQFKQDKILNLIGFGVDNAVHLSELESLTGLDNRDIRKRIEYLRRSGYVIAADRHGYYYPSTYNELSRYVRRTEKQAKSILLTLTTAKKRLKELKDGIQEV